jgi:hypothetical protein
MTKESEQIDGRAPNMEIIDQWTKHQDTNKKNIFALIGLL